MFVMQISLIYAKLHDFEILKVHQRLLKGTKQTNIKDSNLIISTIRHIICTHFVYKKIKSPYQHEAEMSASIMCTSTLMTDLNSQLFKYQRNK